MADITILGSGGFGLALAIMCHTMGHQVTVWSKFQTEIDEIRRAGNCGLASFMLGNEWVYLVNWDGSDAVFKGIYGDLENLETPYVVCTEHTKEAWDAYLNSLPPEPPEDEDPPLFPFWPF